MKRSLQQISLVLTQIIMNQHFHHPHQSASKDLQVILGSREAGGLSSKKAAADWPLDKVRQMGTQGTSHLHCAVVKIVIII